MIGKQGEKTLTYHSGGTDYTALFLVRNYKTHNISPFELMSKKIILMIPHLR
jgi:hypothetical protein